MGEYVTLLGADDICRAGHNIKSAAEDMQRAASSIDETFMQFKLFMDDWLLRFEYIQKENKEDKQ